MTRQSIDKEGDGHRQNRRVNLFGRQYNLPQTRIARLVLGVMLILGGILGFLPILGFWMIPLGIVVLSQDIGIVRRFRRRVWVRFERWRSKRGNKSK